MFKKSFSCKIKKIHQNVKNKGLPKNNALAKIVMQVTIKVKKKQDSLNLVFNNQVIRFLVN